MFTAPPRPVAVQIFLYRGRGWAQTNTDNRFFSAFVHVPYLNYRTYAVTASIQLTACGSMVLSNYDLFVFALCERKNEKKKILEYRSAEG